MFSILDDSFHGKPDAGNLHVRFVEGKGGRKTPFLLYCESVVIFKRLLLIFLNTQEHLCARIIKSNF